MVNSHMQLTLISNITVIISCSSGLVVDHKHTPLSNCSGRRRCVDVFFERHFKSFDNIVSSLNLHVHIHLTFIFSLQTRHINF